jgi:uncharacterized small protein (DUF1192 family)
MDLAPRLGQAAHRAHTLNAWRKIMIFDDDTPPPKPTRLVKLPLDRLGIAELREYIEELREEIARVEADINKKGHSRTAAEAFFRKPPE